MARRLRSAVELYARQTRYIAVALAQAQRSWSAKRMAPLISVLTYLQYEMSRDSIALTRAMLVEQGLETTAVATPVVDSMTGSTGAGAATARLIDTAESLLDLESMMATIIADTNRAMQMVEASTRPEVTGFIRYLNPPSCARCTILAGKVYRMSEGFERHPNCKCVMMPVTNLVHNPDLVTDPQEAFDKGLITDLTVAEAKAIREGADIAQVVNVHKKAAGLRVEGRVLSRAGRLTPEGIYALTDDRDKVIELLQQYGYLSKR